MQVERASQFFGLTDVAAAVYLGEAAEKLFSQPSVLGKLTFLTERAMPTAAAMAKLRMKFPNWSFDTVPYSPNCVPSSLSLSAAPLPLRLLL